MSDAELFLKADIRAKKRRKKIFGPTGGTRGSFAKGAEANRGYIRSKRKTKVKIIDKT